MTRRQKVDAVFPSPQVLLVLSSRHIGMLEVICDKFLMVVGGMAISPYQDI